MTRLDFISILQKEYNLARQAYAKKQDRLYLGKLLAYYQALILFVDVKNQQEEQKK